MKNLLFFAKVLFLCLSTYTFSFGQLPAGTDFYDYITDVLEPLDKSDIVSNTLRDRAIGLYKWSEHSGAQTDTSYLENHDMEYFMHKLRTGFLDGYDPLPLESNYLQYTESNYNGTTTMLSTVAWSYQKLVEDPVGMGLIIADTIQKKLYDVPGRPMSPYLTDTLFAFNALNGNMPVGLNQNFKLTSDLVFTNFPPANQIFIDFDDGSGFIPVAMDINLPVSYTEFGEKNIKIQYVLPSGKILYAASRITVLDEITLKNTDEDVTARVLNSACQAGYDPELYFDLMGGPAGVRTTVAPNCPSGKIIKPFIVIEGFDPVGLGNNNTFESLIERIDFKGISEDFNDGQSNSIVLPTGKDITLLDELYCAGWDIVIIDFQCFGDDDIFVNAQRVQDIIEIINDRKETNGSDEKNILAGTSMGGVIGYRTMQVMEQAAIDHECEYFISFDAPLRGAHIPVGIQYMIKRLDEEKVLTKPLTEDNPFIIGAVAGLKSPAARQLLLRNIYANNNDESTAFRQILHSLPPPSAAKLITISNGSGTGVRQKLNPGEQYLKLAVQTSEEGIRYDMTIEIYAEKHNQDTKVLNMFVKYKIGNVSLGQISIEGGHTNSQAYGSAPGSFNDFTLKHIEKTVSEPNPDLVGLVNPCTGLKIKKTKKRWSQLIHQPSNGAFCFVPTFSALNVPGAVDALNYVPTGCSAGSTDCIWSTNNGRFSHLTEEEEHNQYHVSFSDEIATFILGYLKQQGSSPAELNVIDDRIYNFGDSGLPPVFDPALGYVKTRDIIDFDMNVINEGEVWFNRLGRVDFTDVLPNQFNAPQKFDVSIIGDPCDQSESVVDIGSNSIAKIGQWDLNTNNRSDLTVMEGGVLQTSGDGEIFVDQHSKLIIDGGKVIINPGGKLMTPWNGQIIVKNGGLLEIKGGGHLRIFDDGIVKVEEGGIFRIHEGSRLELWSEIEDEEVGRCNVKIKEAGTFDYRGKPIVSGYGYIQFEEGNIITWEDVTSFAFTGVEKDRLLFRVDANATMRLNDIGLDFRQLRVDYSSNASIWVDRAQKIRLFNVTLQGENKENNIGINAIKNNDIYFLNSLVQNLHTGLKSKENFSGTNYRIENCEFYNNDYSIWSERDDYIVVQSTQIGGGITGIFLDETLRLELQNNSNIGGYLGSPNQDRDNAEGGIVAISSPTRTPNIRLDNSIIANNQVGILAPVGHQCSVQLTNESYIEDNDFGISMAQTDYQNSDSGTTGGNGGVVTVDCSNIIMNRVAGVFGEGIHLMIDASQPSIGSNNFEHGSGSKIFWIWNADNGYCASGIAAYKNYWGPNNYCPTPNDYYIAGANFCMISLGTNCPEELSCESGTDLPPCQQDSGRSCPCPVADDEGLFGNLNQRWNAGVEAYNNGDFEAMEMLFTPVAAMPESLRNQEFSRCAAIVDHARRLIEYQEGSNQGIDPGLGLINESASGENNNRILPNPFNDEIQLEVKDGSMITVFDNNGRRIQVIDAYDTNEINTSQWNSGLYLFLIDNTITGESETIKLIKP